MARMLNRFIGDVGKRWQLLTGTASDFSLETRIFHSISICVVILMSAYVPYNIYAGLYIAALSCILFTSFFVYEYYRSRYLLKNHRSFSFGILGLILLSVNYFANAGIQGSTDLIWPVYLLFVLTICPYRQMARWVIVYLLVFGFAHVIEYMFPELVLYPFREGKGQFTDRITAFPLPVVSMAIIISLFRRNYDKERAVVAQRDNEKSRLLSILSHDLRSPFIQIQQYCELLNDNSLSQSERILVEKELKQTNDQTLDMVTNLLYWSRSQLDGFSIRLTSLPLQHTLNNTIELAGALSREKGIAFEADIQKEINVHADADMLQLVVRNLLQNAIKFTPSGGRISIQSRVNDHVCSVIVTDNGIGIKHEQMQNLFSGAKPAFGTANEKGVGLGLQLCKDFVERQGGSLNVKSETGKGAEFTAKFTLS